MPQLTLKNIVAFAISLILLIVVVYFISKAWSWGQNKPGT